MSREPRRVDVALDEWIATHEAHRADGYTFFDFVTAVDETDRDLPDKPAGFDLVSHLYEIGDGDVPGVRASVMTRARVPLASGDDPAHAPSLTGLWRDSDTQTTDADLLVTTDYRSVLNEVVTRRLGSSTAQVFPGLQPETLGFMHPAA